MFVVIAYGALLLSNIWNSSSYSFTTDVFVLVVETQIMCLWSFQKLMYKTKYLISHNHHGKCFSDDEIVLLNDEKESLDEYGKTISLTLPFLKAILSILKRIF